MAEKAINFTKEQLSVIGARGCDLLVSAAAGSGKTAVLAERIAGLVADGEEPVDIDRVLVVTFTRAAASEMRERIGKALAARMELDPGNRRLKYQELMLPHAKIMTIDAFCQYILRNSFEEIGIDPAFRVADEASMKLILKDSMGEILEEAYAEASSGFLRLTEAFSAGASDRALEEQIEKLYRFAESMPWPALWLRTQIDNAVDLTGKFLDSDWITDVIERISKEIFCGRRELERALKVANEPGGPWMYADCLESEIESLKRLDSLNSFEEFHSAFYDGGTGSIFARLSSKKDPDVLQGKREEVKALRDKVKKLLARLADRYFSTSIEELQKRETGAAESVKELAVLALKLKERVDEKKRDNNIVDFSDMEHLALRVLVKEPDSLKEVFASEPTETAREYAEFFKEIMIDEYQDSNYVQEIILSAISGLFGIRDRFMVGDVKQSIYRFRLARPELFMEKLSGFSKEEGIKQRRIDLHKNFRSRREVIDIVNVVFSRIMAKDVGGVDYDSDAQLRLGADYPVARDLTEEDYSAELLLCTTGDDGDEMRDAGYSGEPDTVRQTESDNKLVLLEEEKPTKEQAEAMMVAERILSLKKDGKVSDGKGGLRPVAYGDIVILLRTTTGVDEVYRDVLGASGIPVYIESRGGYFKTSEVRLILDLLKTLDNPLKDLPLAAVMHSRAFGGFTEEELARVRTAGQGRSLREGHSLYESLMECKEMGDGELSEKCRGFLERINVWREYAQRLAIKDLVDVILEETHYIDLISVMPGGKRRRANVRMLLSMAESSQESGAGGSGLSGFIARMEQYDKVDVDFGEANIISDDADVVRVMSIHRSKGLEFPVVFVSGLSRSFNRSDERAALIMDEKTGPATWAVDLEKRIRYSALKRLAVADSIREESIGEEIRVLYVAMTRAKEKLILTACTSSDRAQSIAENTTRAKGEEMSMENEVGVVSYIDRAHASSFLDLIEAALDGVSAPIRVRPYWNMSESAGVVNSTDTGTEFRYSELMGAIAGNNNSSYYMDRIRANIREKYAHLNLAHLRIKTTVTEMKENIMEEESDKYYSHRLIRSTDETEVVPKFIKNEKELAGRTRGTVYHKIMETLDAEIFDLGEMLTQDINYKKCDIVRSWIKRREESGLLPEGCLETVKPEDILNFLYSDLGKKMALAFRRGVLFRERQFMAEIDAKRVDKDSPEGEPVLLQGVVDAYYIDENGRLVIVDYKTDKVPPFDDGTSLADKYRIQLELYGEILARLTHRDVAQKLIYSFTLGREIAV